jgi:hypothetical protein
MFTAIEIVQIVAIVSLLMVLLILFCAIDLMVYLRKKDQDISGSIVIRWLFLSYSKVFYPHTAVSSASKKDHPLLKKEEMENFEYDVVKNFDKVSKGKITKESKSKKKKKELNAKDTLMIFNNIKKPLLRLVRGTICNLKLRCGRCEVSFGFSDPADTGILCGFLFGLFGSVNQYLKNFSYFLEPKFDEKVLNLEFKADVRVRIYKFIPHVLRFTFDRGVLRTGWLLVRTYR